ncbi:Cell division control protein 50 [Dictyocoela roeselum]|nr:Cell division control protein 50 [Dictyocoela roeselum]
MIKKFIDNRKDEIKNDKMPGIMVNRWYIPFKYILFVFSLISITVGTLLTIYYSSFFSLTLPYTDEEEVNFFIEKDIEKPLFFYLEVHDFYQNHLLFRKSIDFRQLNGKGVTDLAHCAPLDKKSGKIIYPSGLIPNSYLQDQFLLFLGNRHIDISKAGITTSGINKIKRSAYSKKEITKPPLWPKLKLDLEKDERFFNWINVSAFTPFRKLYGRINGLKRGAYTLKITNTFPYGTKYIHVTESSFIGMRNYILSGFMIFNGFLALLLSLYIMKNVK